MEKNKQNELAKAIAASVNWSGLAQYFVNLKIYIDEKKKKK